MNNDLLPYELELQKRLVTPIVEPLLKQISELQEKLKDKPPKGYLNTKDAAKYLGVSVRTIHRKANEKKLKKHYFTNSPSFAIEELESLKF